MAKTIHVISILDRSGSMQGIETEVIGAYNAFIEDQKKVQEKEGVKIKTTLVLFDSFYQEVYSKVPVELTPELNSEVYYPRGMTAYFDAVGKTIEKYNDKKKVIVFIETDGGENSSREFSADQIKSLVEQKKKDGWDFNFVGADLGSVQTAHFASAMGINPEKTMSFAKSSDGYNQRNTAFLSATTEYIKK